MWTAAVPGKLVAGSVAIPNVLGGPPPIRLSLRRPRFSHGHEFNWAANPALARHFTWCDKEISTINAVPGLFNRFVDPTPFLDLARLNAPKKQVRLGSWSVVWAGRNPVVGGLNAGFNQERYIASFVLD